MSEAVFTANHLTDTDKQNENKMRKKNKFMHKNAKAQQNIRVLL